MQALSSCTCTCMQALSRCMSTPVHTRMCCLAPAALEFIVVRVLHAEAARLLAFGASGPCPCDLHAGHLTPIHRRLGLCSQVRANEQPRLLSCACVFVYVCGHGCVNVCVCACPLEQHAARLTPSCCRMGLWLEASICVPLPFPRRVVLQGVHCLYTGLHV